MNRKRRRAYRSSVPTRSWLLEAIGWWDELFVLIFTTPIQTPTATSRFTILYGL
jgi:hypothetical protein